MTAIFQAYIKNFITLNEEEDTLLISKLKIRKYRKGQYILQAGDICKYQTFIVSGSARTFYLDKNGHEHIVSFGIENWWVGDLCSFSAQAPADYDIQCLENTEVIQLSYEDLQYLYEVIPKMERFFRILIQSAYAKTQRRVIDNYSLTAKERYLQFCEEYPKIVERVPQYMVASYLGITKEFLSNIRKQLSKES